MELTNEAKIKARALNGRNGNQVNLDDVAHRVHIIDGACWLWALRGGLDLSAADARSPEIFYRQIFDWSSPSEAEISLPESINQSVACRYPAAIEQIAAVGENLEAAKQGDMAAMENVMQALMSACIIITSDGELTPIPGNPSDSLYKIHMMVELNDKYWYRRGLHWGISVAANDDGTGARCYIQTTTGTPLKTACTKMWDEDYRRCDIAVDGFSQYHRVALG